MLNATNCLVDCLRDHSDGERKSSECDEKSESDNLNPQARDGIDEYNKQTRMRPALVESEKVRKREREKREERGERGEDKSRSKAPILPNETPY